MTDMEFARLRVPFIEDVASAVPRLDGFRFASRGPPFIRPAYHSTEYSVTIAMNASTCASDRIERKTSTNMPRGGKDKYTDKQKLRAELIEEGYEERGLGKEEAERRAWATVNKSSHGGKSANS